MPSRLHASHARLQAGVLAGALLLGGACSSGAKTPALVTHARSTDAKRVLIDSINAVATSTGPVVVGEVRNLSTSPLDGVIVTVDLTDRSGAAIGHQAGPTLLQVVPAGTKASFSIPFTGNKATATTISATVEADPNAGQERVPLTIGSRTTQVLGSNYQVSGTVVNASQVPVAFANVVATFFDSAGKVVGATHDVSDGTPIPPGGSTTFNVFLLEVAPKVSTYSLAAEGQSVAPGH